MLGILAATLVQVATGDPQTLSGQTPLVRPTWQRTPDARQVMQVYPTAGDGKEGRAVIRCQVISGGKLGNCMVVSETPGGVGFGEAAVKLSKLFKLAPVDGDGQPSENRWITVPFRLYPPR